MAEEKKKLWVRKGKLVTVAGSKLALSDHCCCESSSSGSRLTFCYRRWIASCVDDSGKVYPDAGTDAEYHWDPPAQDYAYCTRSKQETWYQNNWVRYTQGRASKWTREVWDSSGNETEASFCRDCTEHSYSGTSPDGPTFTCKCQPVFGTFPLSKWLPSYAYYIQTLYVDEWDDVSQSGPGTFRHDGKITSHVGSDIVPIWMLDDVTRTIEADGHYATVRSRTPFSSVDARYLLCNFGAGNWPFNSRFSFCDESSEDIRRQNASSAWSAGNKGSYQWILYKGKFGSAGMVEIPVEGIKTHGRYLTDVTNPPRGSANLMMYASDNRLFSVHVSDYRAFYVPGENLDAYYYTVMEDRSCSASTQEAVFDSTWGGQWAAGFDSRQWGSITLEKQMDCSYAVVHWVRECTGALAKYENRPVIYAGHDLDVLDGSPRWDYRSYITTELPLEEANESHFTSALDKATGKPAEACTTGHCSMQVMGMKCPEYYYLFQEFAFNGCETDPPIEIPVGMQAVEESGSQGGGDEAVKPGDPQYCTAPGFTYADCVARSPLSAGQLAMYQGKWSPAGYWASTYWLHLDEETDNKTARTFNGDTDGYAFRVVPLSIGYYPKWFSVDMCRTVLNPVDGLVPRMKYEEVDWYMMETVDYSGYESSGNWWPNTDKRRRSFAGYPCRDNTNGDYAHALGMPDPEKTTNGVVFGDCSEARVLAVFDELGPDRSSGGIRIQLSPNIYELTGCPGWKLAYSVNWEWDYVYSRTFSSAGKVDHWSASSNGCSSGYLIRDAFGHLNTPTLNWFGHIRDPRSSGGTMEDEWVEIGMSSRVETWSEHYVAENEWSETIRHTSTLKHASITVYTYPAFCCEEGTLSQTVPDETAMAGAWSGCGDYLDDGDNSKPPSDEDDQSGGGGGGGGDQSEGNKHTKRPPIFIDPPEPSDTTLETFFRKHRKVRIPKGAVIKAKLWCKRDQRWRHLKDDDGCNHIDMMCNHDVGNDEGSMTFDVDWSSSMTVEEDLVLDGEGYVADVLFGEVGIDGDPCELVRYNATRSVHATHSMFFPEEQDRGELTEYTQEDSTFPVKYQNVMKYVRLSRKYTKKGYVLTASIPAQWGRYACGFNCETMGVLTRPGWDLWPLFTVRWTADSYEQVQHGVQSPPPIPADPDKVVNSWYRWTYRNQGIVPPSRDDLDKPLPKRYWKRNGMYVKEWCEQSFNWKMHVNEPRTVVQDGTVISSYQLVEDVDDEGTLTMGCMAWIEFPPNTGWL